MTRGQEQWSGKLCGAVKAGNPSSPTPQGPLELGGGQRSGGCDPNLRARAARWGRESIQTPGEGL